METLRNLRVEKGYTQLRMAELLEIQRPTYSRYESGERQPDHDTLLKLADIFNVSIDYLLGRTDTTKPQESSNVIFLNDKNIYMLPVFESVSAGFGSSANDDITDYMPCYLNSEYEAQDSIFIRVSGDSMYPKIEEGDLIQVHKQTSVDSGSIAVVLLDQTDGLVKRVEYGTDWIELHSINPMYPVQRFEGKDVLRIEILGLVKKIIKSV